MDLNKQFQLLIKFPKLASTKFEQTSNPTASYNCIAWAAGEDHRWWWPDAMKTKYWPKDIPRDKGLSTFIQAFENLGYQNCSDEDLEEGIIRIALFADSNGTTHAARQRLDGYWTSKLGAWLDIRHELRAVEGNDYGTVQHIMKAKLSSLCQAGTKKHFILTCIN